MCGTEWWKMNVRLSEIARAVGGVVTGPDREVHGIVTDNREIKNGYTLFCAIRGARVDGHDYVAKVLEDATCSALVDDVRFSYPGTVLVDDVVSAIARNTGVACISATFVSSGLREVSAKPLRKK